MLHTPDGRTTPLKVRSMVGLIPLFAVEMLEPELLERVPEFAARLEWFLNYRPDLAQLVSHWDEPGRGERRLLSLLRGHRMKKLLRRMLDPTANSSPTYGVRALSKVHEREPYVFKRGRRGAHGALRAGRIGLGPVRRQLQLARPDLVAGELPDHRVAAEVSSLLRRRFQGRMPDRLRPAASRIDQVADELATRLERLFLKDEQRPAAGARAVSAACRPTRTSATTCCSTSTSTATPAAASVQRHQTGWTGLVAKLLKPRLPQHGDRRHARRD